MVIRKPFRCACKALAIVSVAFSLNTRASEVIADAFKSNALGRDYKFRVYLPDDYKVKEQLFPVIYLLHGAGGNEASWSAQNNAKEIFDALIKRGSMRPSIAVMPDGGNSWWTDGAAEKAETALMEELLPYVEGKYRIARQRDMRAIGGISMGGYGALNLALRFPDKFCAAALLSPAIYDPAPPKNSAAVSARQFFKEDKFDIELWKSLNYPARLDAYNKAAQKVSIWIVSGDHDSLGIALQSAQFYWRLFQTQPKQIELRIIDGDHEWMVWRDALPDALRYLDEQCARSQ